MSLPLYRICSQTTQYGGRCRHNAVRNGLCGTHSRRHSGADVIDPLEAIDWSPPVETLAALDRAGRRPQHDRDKQQDTQETDMSSDKSRENKEKAAGREAPLSPEQTTGGSDAGRGDARHLKAVPDLPGDSGTGRLERLWRIHVSPSW